MSYASFTVRMETNSKTAQLLNSGMNSIFPNTKQHRCYNDNALKAIIHLFSIRCEPVIEISRKKDKFKPFVS